MCCLYFICCYLVPDLKRNSTNVFNYSMQITLKPNFLFFLVYMGYQCLSQYYFKIFNT